MIFSIRANISSAIDNLPGSLSPPARTAHICPDTLWALIIEESSSIYLYMVYYMYMHSIYGIYIHIMQFCPDAQAKPPIIYRGE